MKPILRFFAVSLTCLLVSSPLFAQSKGDPKANPKAEIIVGNARFTILTPRLVRLEWNPKGQFEDRASFVFVNRNLPVPDFKTQHVNGDLHINTGALQIRYKENSGKFTAANLQIEFKVDGKWNTWHPGLKDTANLKGTIRTLDGVKGAAKLPHGLLSRSGWYVVNDSNRPLFDNSSWPWVVPRAKGERQDWYFFGYGHHYKEELHDFTKVAGKIPMPPRFAFGFWWSRYWAYTDQGFKDLVHQFHTHNVPLNVLVLDMDWHKTWGLKWGHQQTDQAGQPKGWTGYTWNPTYFPNPTHFLNWTKKEGLKVTLNLHPASGIQPYEAPYKAMARAMGVNPATKKYIPFDITNKKFAENYFKYVLDPFVKQGVDFWWLDWQQWSTTPIPGVTPTWWLNYVFYTHMERTRNVRPLIYHRWGGLGNHRYEIGFSGDVISVWSSLNFQPYFTATASNVCYGYWSHDIGGHIYGHDSPELFTRWVQWGAFSPVMRTHVTKNPFGERRIWAYPYHYARAMRDAVILRYKLVPYIYTASREAYDTGVSLMRPMYYSWPEAGSAYRFRNEYMFGDNLMVEPITHPMGVDSVFHYKRLMSTEKVWLPKGKWVEWPTGTSFKGDTTLNRAFTIDEIPVYAKLGAVIPMQTKNDFKKNSDQSIDPLVLTVFAGDSSSTHLYEDAGNSKKYEDGDYAWTNIHHLEPDDHTIRIVVDPTKGSFKGMSDHRSYIIRLLNTWPAAGVTENGKSISYNDTGNGTGWWYAGNDFATVIRLPESSIRRKTEITVHFKYSIHSSLLNGMRGNIKRLEAAMHILNQLSKNQFMQNGYDGNVWAPQDLIDLYQTGHRIALDPDSAMQELEQFHRKLPGVIKEVQHMHGDHAYIEQALHQLYTMHFNR